MTLCKQSVFCATVELFLFFIWLRLRVSVYDIDFSHIDMQIRNDFRNLQIPSLVEKLNINKNNDLKSWIGVCSHFGKKTWRQERV